MNVKILRYPSEEDWKGVLQRALVTVGKDSDKAPSPTFRYHQLAARHSPIRYLQFSFLLEGIPSWVSVHLCRHVHAQPYVRSQRNDRQGEYDRNKAPQDAPVNMIIDMNGEELITIANKRLCRQTAKETREVVTKMCELAAKSCPEMALELVPMCFRNGGVCYEPKCCGLNNVYKQNKLEENANEYAGN